MTDAVYQATVSQGATYSAFQTSTFNIQNNDPVNTLYLTGTPLVQISDPSSGYALTTAPAQSIPPGGSTSFTVTFTNPQTATIYTTTVSIPTSDGSANPFSFKMSINPSS